MSELSLSQLMDKQHKLISGIDLSKLPISKALSIDARNGDEVALRVLRRIQAAKREASIAKITRMAESSSGWL